MNCWLCGGAIEAGSRVDYHHPVYRSAGGTETVAVHRRCHVEYHTRQGDFKRWGAVGGQLSALTGRWAFNLKGVRDDPAYHLTRQFYLAMYRP